MAASVAGASSWDRLKIDIVSIFSLAAFSGKQSFETDILSGLKMQKSREEAPATAATITLPSMLKQATLVRKIA